MTTTKIHGFRIEKTGAPDVLKWQEFDVPELKPGQALVRLHAVGVNFLDVGQRKGIYPASLPFVPGVEASGVVEKVASDVTHVKAGQRVAYTGGPASYAEANIIDADRLIPVPADFDFIQAAAFPLQGMTAHYLMTEFYKLKPGDTVLIHAAAGGMGLLLVQWAKHLGARVIGTVSTEEKAEIARAAGADDVILYTKQDFVAECKKLTGGKGVDYVIDGVGKDTFTKSLEALRLRGHITIFGAASGLAEPLVPNALMMKSITVSGGSLFNFLLSREELMMRSSDVLQAIKEGWLKLRVEHVLPLKDAPKAHELMENRKTVGKIVLTV
jgi:NADPH:quinone reductase